MALPKIDTPKYEAKIPSTGKKVSFRPFLVKEEKVLMIAFESKDQNQMLGAAKDVIRSCTFGAIEPDDLTIFDIEYLFMRLRMKSVGETTQLSFACEHCQARTDVTINLEEAAVDMSKAKPHRVKITDKIGIELKYPQIAAASQIALEKDESKRDSLLLVADCIVSVWDDKKVYTDSTVEERLELIENLTTEQFAPIDEFFTSMPKLTQTVKWKCQKCQKENSFTIEGMQNFFYSPSPTTRS